MPIVVNPILVDRLMPDLFLLVVEKLEPMQPEVRTGQTLYSGAAQCKLHTTGTASTHMRVYDI